MAAVDLLDVLRSTHARSTRNSTQNSPPTAGVERLVRHREPAEFVPGFLDGHGNAIDWGTSEGDRRYLSRERVIHSMERRGFTALVIASLASLAGIFTLPIEGSLDEGGMYLKAIYYEGVPNDTIVVTENDKRLANNDVLVSFIDDVKIRLEDPGPQSDPKHQRSIFLEAAISDGEYSDIIEVMDRVDPDRRPGSGIFVTTGENTFEIVMVGED